MQTYLFVVPTAFRVSAILKTDVYRELVQSGDETIIVSPFAKDSAFTAEFPKSTHYPMADIPLRRIRRISRLREILLAVHHPVLNQARLIERSVMKLQKIEVFSLKERLLLLVRLLAMPFSRIIMTMFDKLEEHALTIASYDDVISKHRPRGIILGTLTEPEDIVWLAISRRFSIPAHVIDFPWS